ncbi:MAG: diacylglycerol kinase [Rhodobacterales bacterium]|nr:diacylglycerol kinase [Rhodobacterales bacterium]MDX5389668.1 diacylglycerol kinase [Rhodobacterales bacterium]MDX5489365.1 diacylglycerol kinase [Rhodobacterales bacterium]
MNQKKPDRKTGFAHLIAATGYSMAGLRRLWQESAFRQETIGGALVLLLLLALDASARQIGLMAVMLLALLAIEGLNTAIEAIVDQLSPDWSVFAKQAKDIASAAVFLMILANGICLSVILVDLARTTA